MTKTEREKLDIEIYLRTKDFRGCIDDCADYLRHKDSSRVSRMINPQDARANNIFGEAVDVLQGFNHKHPELARFIREKLMLAINSFMEAPTPAELLMNEIADTAAREQLDVNFAVSRRAAPEEIENEAFQALQLSKRQYDAAVALRRGGQSKEEIQSSYFPN